MESGVARDMIFLGGKVESAVAGMYLTHLFILLVGLGLGMLRITLANGPLAFILFNGFKSTLVLPQVICT
jgi:hypothetical protein